MEATNAQKRTKLTRHNLRKRPLASKENVKVAPPGTYLIPVDQSRPIIVRNKLKKSAAMATTESSSSTGPSAVASENEGSTTNQHTAGVQPADIEPDLSSSDHTCCLACQETSEKILAAVSRFIDELEKNNAIMTKVLNTLRPMQAIRRNALDFVIDDDDLI